MNTPDVVTIGEAMASFRSSGSLAFGTPAVPGLAGAESNVAIGLARLGHAVQWVGRVGADRFGELALRELRAEGVGVEHVVVDADSPTGLMFLEQRTADIATVEYRRSGSAGSRLGPDDVTAALRPAPRAVHLSGVTPALSDSARAAFIAAIELAREAGGFVSLDVNHRARLWGRDECRAVLASAARSADLVVASEDELDLVAAGCESEAVESLLGAGVSMVAVKRGPAGASLWTADGRVDQPAFVVTSVDTVGAGDAFCAGFLSGWLDGLDGPGCLERGALLGAWAVSTRGDWEGLPRRSELETLAVLTTTGETLR
jgi:2-dehydro-3-deoxygluconokinase